MNVPIVDTVGQLLLDVLEDDAAGIEITPETQLFDGGLGLDSFAIVELITRIEDHYNFEFAEEDLRPESFITLNAIAAVVAARAGHSLTASSG